LTFYNKKKIIKGVNIIFLHSVYFATLVLIDACLLRE